MATSRDELREHLVAAMEAAPELPRGDRQHLADVFLDQLNADYELVPRGTGGTPRSARRPNRGGGTPRWVKIALVLAFLIFVVPAAFHHFPIFLLVVVAVFLAMRRARSRRSWTAMFG